MALVAPIQDGKFVESASQSSLNKTGKSGDMSKDTFLQLLVAEVQNQDPLEPSSNTEWISQYATFSELEAMQNFAGSQDISRASSLVGKTVALETTSSDGKTTTVQGKVDYISIENGEPYLGINGELYSLSDLINVVDETYLAAVDKVYDWSVKLNKLPKPEALDLSYRQDVEALAKEYNGMSDYEKTFIVQENRDKIEALEERMNMMVAAKEALSEAAEKEASEEALDALTADREV